jgi:hypothetical protein
MRSGESEDCRSVDGFFKSRTGKNRRGKSNMLTANLLVTLMAALTLGLLLLMWLQLRQSATKADLAEIARLAQLGPTKVLVERVQMVRPGDTRADVERLLGRADNPTDGEWFYYLDEHAGYVVFFDHEDRVEAVKSWKS